MPELPFAPPPVLPLSHRTGTQLLGQTYERKVGRQLALFASSLGWDFHNHPWLRAQRGLCQPDFLLVSPSGCILLVEAKLTECDCSAQLNKYRRALEGFTVTALQVARRVTSRPTVDCFENTIDNGLMLLWE